MLTDLEMSKVFCIFVSVAAIEAFLNAQELSAFK